MALAIRSESFFSCILVSFSLEVREAQLGAPALFKRILQGCFSVKVKPDDTEKRASHLLAKTSTISKLIYAFFHIHFCDHL